MAPRFRALNSAVAQLLDEFSLVSFLTLDISDEESIGEVRRGRPGRQGAALSGRERRLDRRRAGRALLPDPACI
jgi:hypothetical protein